MSDLFTYVKHDSDNQILLSLFKAYRNARKNKRAKRSQVAFEYAYESKLIKLHKDIMNRRYQPLPSTAFISTKPVIREVFAADFQDRVVHHLIFNAISPIFEKEFIKDSYSCREGKGTLYGVNRVFSFIDKSSQHYTNKSYILKLDVQGYFYSINRSRLYTMVRDTLVKKEHLLPLPFDDIDYLIKTTIFSDPTHEVKIYKDDKNWKILPKNKSLFFAKKGCGLPIGNLTSQLFSNIYMNCLDHYVTKALGVNYYGRYVDDFVLIHNDKAFLRACVDKIKLFLEETLVLTLHPKKVYLQEIKRGVKFLGAYIKPYVIFIDQRTKGNFYALVYKINREFDRRNNDDRYLFKIRNSINSYLGTMIHFSSYRLRKAILSSLTKSFFHYFMLDKNFSRVILKAYY